MQNKHSINCPGLSVSHRQGQLLSQQVQRYILWVHHQKEIGYSQFSYRQADHQFKQSSGVQKLLRPSNLRIKWKRELFITKRITWKNIKVIEFCVTVESL